MNTSEFIQQNAPDGEMTPEQAAQLLELADQGDTNTQLLEEGSEPAAAPVVEDNSQDASADDNVTKTDEPAPATAPEDDPVNTVIMAKDGKHTISYDKLVEAREGKQAADAIAQEALTKLQEAQKELDALRAQSQQRADAGIDTTVTDKNLAAAEAAIDAGVDPELFGDFSEEAIAKGVKALVVQSVPELVAQLVKKELAPLQQKQDLTEHDAHLASIYAKHPDIDSIVESQELKQWIESQPAFARPGYQAVLENGSAEQIIEFIDTFKEATGKAQAAAPSEERVKAAAKQAIASAKVPVPASLSDISGGRAGPAGQAEALANLNPIDMSEAMASMSPDQIEEYLNRSV